MSIVRRFKIQIFLALKVRGANDAVICKLFEKVPEHGHIANDHRTAHLIEEIKHAHAAFVECAGLGSCN